MATIADRYEQLLTVGYAPDRAVAAFLAALCLEADDDTELGAQVRLLVAAQIDHAAHSITALRTQLQLAAEPRVAAFTHVLQTANRLALTAAGISSLEDQILVHLWPAGGDRKVSPDQGRAYIRALTGADPTNELLLAADPTRASVLWVDGVLTLPDGSRITIQVATDPDQDGPEHGASTAATS
jgi:hypothetical protein